MKPCYLFALLCLPVVYGHYQFSGRAGEGADPANGVQGMVYKYKMGLGEVGPHPCNGLNPPVDAPVTLVRPGTLMVEVEETGHHEGQFAIRLSKPQTLGQTAPYLNSDFCMLLDHVPQHNTSIDPTTTKDYQYFMQFPVTIPDFKCDHCILEFLAIEHGAAPCLAPNNCKIYHGCAVVNITGTQQFDLNQCGERCDWPYLYWKENMYSNPRTTEWKLITPSDRYTVTKRTARLNIYGKPYVYPIGAAAPAKAPAAKKCFQPTPVPTMALANRMALQTLGPPTGGMTIKIDRFINHFEVEFSGANANWMAIGFGKTMTNTDAWVVGTGVNGARLPYEPYDYWLRGHGLVNVMVDTQQDLSILSNYVVNGVRTCRIGRLYSTGDPKDYVFPKTASQIDIVYAWGNIGAKLHAHTFSDRGTKTISFSAVHSGSPSSGGGSSTSTTALRSDYTKAHGSFMFMAWGILMPVAVAVARYRYLLFATNNSQKLWSHIHSISTVIAVLFTLLGILIKVGEYKGEFRIHFHSVVGLTLFLLSLLHCVGGFFRPDESHSLHNVADGVHRYGGFALLLLSFLVICVGLSLPPVPVGVWVGYMLWCLMWIGTIGFLEYKNRKSDKQPSMGERDRQLSAQGVYGGADIGVTSEGATGNNDTLTHPSGPPPVPINTTPAYGNRPPPPPR